MQVESSCPLGRACQDGTLLVDLVQRLENCHIHGASARPKSTAAALFNVRAVLKKLGTKPAMPLQSLFCDSEIVAGHTDAAELLLWHVFGVYEGLLGV